MVAGAAPLDDPGQPLHLTRQIRLLVAAAPSGPAQKRSPADRSGTARTAGRPPRRGTPRSAPSRAARTPSGPAPRRLRHPAMHPTARGPRSTSARAERLRRQPDAVIAADQHGLQRLGRTTGQGDEVAQATAVRRLVHARLPHAPLTVARNVPGCSAVPTSRNQPAPRRAISARCASVSTFWTSVGAAPIPLPHNQIRHVARDRPAALDRGDDGGLLPGDERLRRRSPPRPGTGSVRSASARRTAASADART